MITAAMLMCHLRPNCHKGCHKVFAIVTHLGKVSGLAYLFLTHCAFKLSMYLVHNKIWNWFFVTEIFIIITAKLDEVNNRGILLCSYVTILHGPSFLFITSSD
jgi:hypothetical protein